MQNAQADSLKSELSSPDLWFHFRSTLKRVFSEDAVSSHLVVPFKVSLDKHTGNNITR